ncbi:hypothetical protein FE257_011620 [Aspergillus nanangensis]|uniref:Uncharacterized protein n=1 Tax=Aspergillus nanangensis TaxID=2582783 RepID=A0AAD4CVG9_ASPNN|nr:hypothetical protein FE257_011620 [Aspergillus nanangensis]
MSLARLRRPRVWLIAATAMILAMAWISLYTSPFSLSSFLYYTPFQRPNTPKTTPYSRTLVVAKTHSADTTWVDEVVADEDNGNAAPLSTAVYVVDDANAPLTVPMNKGHEVMAYLTYIIEHYFSLRDVTIFMHSDRMTWHNNDLLDMDSAAMVRRLKSAYIVDRGYANLRCHHDPGCPAHVRLTGDGDDFNVPEAGLISAAWGDVFPEDAMPEVLAQPCCSQFAVSAETIRRVPLLQFVAYRRWLMETELDDLLSGRVWEYLWQWLFMGKAVDCPDERVCYCEGYGVCVEHEEYDRFFRLRNEAWQIEAAMRLLNPDDDRLAMQAGVDALHGEMEKIKMRALG